MPEKAERYPRKLEFWARRKFKVGVAGSGYIEGESRVGGFVISAVGVVVAAAWC